MDSNAPDRIADGEFLGSAVEAIPSNAAVLDTEGTIVSTNSAWEEAAEGTDNWLQTPAVGTDYINALATTEEASASHLVTGLRAVLEGDREQFEMEVPCRFPMGHDRA